MELSRFELLMALLVFYIILGCSSTASPRWC
jgi:hypothetical protein